MYIRLWISCVLLVFVLVPGCARMEFYSDPELKKKTGLKHYPAKPYILVTRTGNKEKPVEVSMISLPDVANPAYAHFISGWGAAKLSMTLKDGMITSVGQETDSKIPETLGALANLIPGIGSGVKSLAEAKQIVSSINSDKGAAVDETDYKSLASDLSDAAKVMEETAELKHGFLSSEVKKFNLAKGPGALRKAADLIDKKSPASGAVAKAISIIESVLNDWVDAPAASEAANDVAKTQYRTLSEQKRKVMDVLEKLKGPQVERPVFELYEFYKEKEGEEVKVRLVYSYP